MEEPITRRPFAGIVLQADDFSIDPDIDFPNTQSVLLHLYLDGLSRNTTDTNAKRGTAMTGASTSPDPSAIIYHNCGKARHSRSGCALPVKAHGKPNKTEGQETKYLSRSSAGRTWCSVYQKTTHIPRRALRARGSSPTGD